MLNLLVKNASQSLLDFFGSEEIDDRIGHVRYKRVQEKEDSVHIGSHCDKGENAYNVDKESRGVIQSDDQQMGHTGVKRFLEVLSACH